jgi:hypothetical protein
MKNTQLKKCKSTCIGKIKQKKENNWMGYGIFAFISTWEHKETVMIYRYALVCLHNTILAFVSTRC